jgi:four helix bundle suffix protein
MTEIIVLHGGYRHLLSFQIAQLVYDITVRFCERYLEKYSRTRDQMVQAARSGVQNIAEGSMASATSKKTEIKLTQVARASLEELKLDYEDFLRQKHLPQWEENDERWKTLINRKCRTAEDVIEWIKQESKTAAGIGFRNLFPEYSANAAIILIKVASSLLSKQVSRLAEDFAAEGGFSERLYKVRKEERQKPKN